MKKKQVEDEEEEDQKKLEMIKAAAQAWHGRSSSSSMETNEFQAHRRNLIKGKPSRFMLEAMNITNKANVSPLAGSTGSSTYWDFGQSLLDSYEIVSVSKKLERGLALDNPFSGGDGDYVSRVHRPRRKESRNSLRSLFDSVYSSRRFNESEVPREN